MKEARAHLKAMQLKHLERTRPNLPYKESFLPRYNQKNKETRILRMCEDFCDLVPRCKMNRIDNRGTRIDNTKKVTDVLGNRKVIGSIEYRKSSMQNGIADLVGMINGRYVAMELKRVYKNGKDRQSEAQKKYQREVEEGGGLYIIFTDFGDFYKKFWNIYGVE